MTDSGAQRTMMELLLDGGSGAKELKRSTVDRYHSTLKTAFPDYPTLDHEAAWERIKDHKPEYIRNACSAAVRLCKALGRPGDADQWSKWMATIRAKCKPVDVNISESDLKKAMEFDYDGEIRLMCARLNARNGQKPERRIRNMQKLIILYMSRDAVSRAQDIRLLTCKDDEVNNYLDLEARTVHLRKYKTVGSRGAKTIEVCGGLVAAAHALVEAVRGLAPSYDGGRLFVRVKAGCAVSISETAFSDIVKGATGGLNLTKLRKGTASREGDREAAEKLAKLADKMNHSVSTSAAHYQASRKRQRDGGVVSVKSD